MVGADRKAIVVSASSDIGTAMCRRWLARGWTVVGTYRTDSAAVDELRGQGAELVYCDLLDVASIEEAGAALSGLPGTPGWDVLALCAGLQEPIGPFADTSFDEWEKAVGVNFTGQMRIIHGLLPSRRVGTNPDRGPCVLLFAGAGTNSAFVNYSAYVVSKIALIKMCELLDAEISDTRFVIIGPGAVNTKIHKSSLTAGDRAGDDYQRVIDRLAANGYTSLERVLDCCDWAVDAPRQVVSGRNFSLVFDKWGTKELEERLVQEPDMYKLRRHGNDWLAQRRQRG